MPDTDLGDGGNEEDHVKDGEEVIVEDTEEAALDPPLSVMLNHLENTLDADIFSYVGDISSRGFGLLVEAIFKHKENDNVLLILTTNGGSGNSAYQIARFLQKIYKRFYLYTPSYCKSAGTMVALGAHHLFMDPFSELGPLDVQLLKPNELGERKSGLLTRSAFEGLAEASFDLFEQLMLKTIRKGGGLVSFRVAAELSASMTGSIMANVYGKIDPEVVGSDRRDLDVALHYGLRLISHSENADPSTVLHLVNHYPAHDFIIDDSEARSLFENVTYPPSPLMALAGKLNLRSYAESDGVTVMALKPTAFADDETDGEDDNEASPAVPQPSSSSHPGPADSGDGDREGDSSSGDEAGAVPGSQPDPALSGAVRHPKRRSNG